MTWFLLAVALALVVGATARLAVAGTWRRGYVRLRWKSIARSVGASVRRDRVTRRLAGPGEKVSLTEAIEHLPTLLGIFGRRLGPIGRPYGARWTVWSAHGADTTELAKAEARLAASTWCARAVVTARSPRRADLLLLWHDPLAETRPWVEAERGMLCPAFDVTGEPVEVPVLSDWGGSWLIGGASGSGKSGWLGALVAGLAATPHVNLLGVDPKRVELAPWAPALRAVAHDRKDALRLVDIAARWLDQRMLDLAAEGLRHVPAVPCERWPFLGLIIDELAVLIDGTKDDLTALLVRLAQLGRAGGLIIVAATQRPSTDAVPPQLKDQLQRRVLTRPPSIDSGQVVLGWRPTEADVEQLDRPGVAWLDLPGRRPILARSTFGTTSDVDRWLAAHNLIPTTREAIPA